MLSVSRNWLVFVGLSVLAGCTSKTSDPAQSTLNSIQRSVNDFFVIFTGGGSNPVPPTWQGAETKINAPEESQEYWCLIHPCPDASEPTSGDPVALSGKAVMQESVPFFDLHSAGDKPARFGIQYTGDLDLIAKSYVGHNWNISIPVVIMTPTLVKRKPYGGPQDIGGGSVVTGDKSTEQGGSSGSGSSGGSGSPPPPLIGSGLGDTFLISGTSIASYDNKDVTKPVPRGIQNSKMRYVGMVVGAKGVLVLPDEVVVRSEDGATQRFLPPQGKKQSDRYTSGAVEYVLSEVSYPDGKKLSYEYEPVGSGGSLRPITMTDSSGRVTLFRYDGEGFLSEVEDFSGRIWTLNYDSNYDLVSVVFPQSSEQSKAKTVRFEYDTHRMTKEYEPNHIDTPTFINTYSGDSIVSQEMGDSKHLYNVNGAINGYDERLRLHVAPSGTATLYHFDSNWKIKSRWVFGRVLDPNNLGMATTPIIQLVNFKNGIHGYQTPTNEDKLVLGSKYNSTDPESLVTQYEYDVYGNNTKVIHPNGDVVTSVYDSDSSDIYKRSHLVSQTFAPADGAAAVTSYSYYDPVFGAVLARSDPRGLASGYTPPNGGGASALRYLGVHVLDYMESPLAQNQPLKDVVDNWGIDMSQTSLEAKLPATFVSAVKTKLGAGPFGILGLGDVNGDGKTKQISGNIIANYDVSPNVPADPADLSAGYVTVNVVTKNHYNDEGCLSKIIGPKGETTVYERNSALDPTGVSPGSASGPSTQSGIGGCGFPNKSISATGGATLYEYNQYGDETKRTDSRGYVVQKAYDELRRLTETTDSYGRAKRYTYDLAGNILTETVENCSFPIDPISFLPGLNWDCTGTITTSHSYDVQNHLTKSVVVGRKDGYPTQTLQTENYYNRAEQLALIVSSGAKDGSEPFSVVSYLYGTFGKISKVTTGGVLPEFSSAAVNSNIPASVMPGLHPDAGTVTYNYDTYQRLATVINPLNQTAKLLEYDSYGRNYRTTDALGQVVRNFYDSAGEVIETRSISSAAHGSKVVARQLNYVDELNRTFRSRLARYGADFQLLGWTSYVNKFDERSNAVVAADPIGNKVFSDYDITGRNTAAYDQFGNRTDFVFDSENHPVRQDTKRRDVGGTTLVKSKFHFYDKVGQLRATTNSLNETHYALFDSLGNVVFKTVDSKSFGQKILLKSLDTLNEIPGIDPAVMTNAYGNNVVFETDSLGRPLAAVFPKRLNGLGMQSVIETHEERVTYNSAGRIATKTDRNGNSTSFTYDSLGRLLQTTKANQSSVKITKFNKLGQVLESRDANDTVVTRTYDELGRLKGKTIQKGPGITAGPDWEFFEYDAFGNQNRVTSDLGSVTKVYGTDGVYKETVTGALDSYTFDYTFDSNGRSKTMTYPSGQTITLGYNSENKVDTVDTAAFGGHPIQFSYLGAGLLERMTLPSGAELSQTYDGADRLRSKSYKTSSNQVIFSATSSQMDGAWQVTGQQESWTLPGGTTTGNQTLTYTYDSQGRLIQSQNQSQNTGSPVSTWTVSYVLDKTGNRTGLTYQTQVTGLGQKFGPSVYNPNSVNQYASTSLGSYQYDDNGNTTVLDSRLALGWTWQNLLDQATDSVGQVTRYNYDALGRLSRIKKGTLDYRFRYCGSSICEFSRSAGQTFADVVFSKQDQPILQIETNGSITYFAQDQLSSVRALFGDQGQIFEANSYTDYGSRLNPGSLTPVSDQAPSKTIFAYTGKPLDPTTGLYYYLARFYDPVLGRFLSEDPAQDGTNYYAYTDNNPINFNDPSGLSRRPRDGDGAGGMPGPPRNPVDTVTEGYRIMAAALGAVSKYLSPEVAKVLGSYAFALSNINIPRTDVPRNDRGFIMGNQRRQTPESDEEAWGRLSVAAQVEEWLERNGSNRLCTNGWFDDHSANSTDVDVIVEYVDEGWKEDWETFEDLLRETTGSQYLLRGDFSGWFGHMTGKTDIDNAAVAYGNGNKVGAAIGVGTATLKVASAVLLCRGIVQGFLGGLESTVARTSLTRTEFPVYNGETGTVRELLPGDTRLYRVESTSVPTPMTPHESPFFDGSRYGISEARGPSSVLYVSTDERALTALRQSQGYFDDASTVLRTTTVDEVMSANPNAKIFQDTSFNGTVLGESSGGYVIVVEP